MCPLRVQISPLKIVKPPHRYERPGAGTTEGSVPRCVFILSQKLRASHPFALRASLFPQQSGVRSLNEMGGPVNCVGMAAGFMCTMLMSRDNTRLCRTMPLRTSSLFAVLAI